MHTVKRRSPVDAVMLEYLESRIECQSIERVDIVETNVLKVTDTYHKLVRNDATGKQARHAVQYEHALQFGNEVANRMR